jgi:hypothetical protein
MEQDPGVGGMSVRAAWVLAALCVAMFVAVVMLDILTRCVRSPGNTTTLGTISETAIASGWTRKLCHARLVSASWRGKPVRRSRPKTVPLHDASVPFPHYKDA